MSYSERAYSGPDMAGRPYPAEPVAHCAARDEWLRLVRISDRARLRRDARGAAYGKLLVGVPLDERGVVPHGVPTACERVQGPAVVGRAEA